MNKLALVVPCYNEEAVLNHTATVLVEKFKTLIKDKVISEDSRITFVDDGSKDKTWSIIQELHSKETLIDGVKLSRNRGHQNALLGGLLTVNPHFDVTISMDADLQDDIHAIDGMLKAYKEGHDVVYGVRSKRDTDTFFKRFTAEGFYKVMSKLGVEIVFNHADYRLMSKRAVEGLKDFKEVNLFLRSMVPLIGYSSTTVEYERNERFAGESKYPLRKMIEFALDGITSFSVKPLRMITSLGIGLFTISILMTLYFLIIHFMGKTVAGWTTIVVSVWAIGGLQLFAIGMVGEYIGKMYLETKERPKFFIEDYLD